MFVLCLSIFVFLDKRNEKISRNIVKIKAKLFAESDRGDEFASLFNLAQLYEDTALHPKYSFLDKYGYDKKLIIGPSEEKFWEAYNREKEQFTKDPNHRLYKLFVDNVGYEGELAEQDGVIHFMIKKAKPNYSNMFQNCNSLTTISFPKYITIRYNPTAVTHGMSYYNPAQANPNPNDLSCPVFEKMRTLWKNSTEDKDSFTFIIKADEIEDFCSMCELVCGEELSW